MKAIFLTKECILIQTWKESVLLSSGEISEEYKISITKESDNFTRMDIINSAFQIKKYLDKRDLFILIK